MMSSYECHRTLLMISQHWFRKWLGAVRQQATTWANVDPDLCHHMASLGHNGLIGKWRSLVFNSKTHLTIPHNALDKISHNAPICNRNVHISLTKRCIVGYVTGALWDLCDRSIDLWPFIFVVMGTHKLNILTNCQLIEISMPVIWNILKCQGQLDGNPCPISM